MGFQPIWHKRKHDLGGAQHVADTLADLNAKISDATLVDSPNKVLWKSVKHRVLALTEQDADIDWTEIDLTVATSSNATMALLRMILMPRVIGTGTWILYSVRKKNDTGSGATRYTQNECHAFVTMEEQIWIGLDSAQVIEYALDLTTDWEVDIWIDVYAYVE